MTVMVGRSEVEDADQDMSTPVRSGATPFCIKEQYGSVRRLRGSAEIASVGVSKTSAIRNGTK